MLCFVDFTCWTTRGMYVCSKVKNSQARTGHQRGMGGRKTDDDDTHEPDTDHPARWVRFFVQLKS